MAQLQNNNASSTSISEWEYTQNEIAQLSLLQSEGKSFSQIGQIMNISSDAAKLMAGKLTEIKLKIKCKIIDELTNCSQSFTTVNIQNITLKLQTHFNVNLKSKYWQSFIAKTMANQLTMLSFVKANEEEEFDNIELEFDVEEDESLSSNEGTHSLTLDLPNESTEEKNDSSNEELYKTMVSKETETPKGDNTFDCIPIRWKLSKHFKVELGIQTTQITKITSSYSSIYSLEPITHSRIFEYTFLLNNIRESGKPWIGIGIVSSKCPLLSKMTEISWHGSNKYSVGWYYGTNIWQNHKPLNSSYGNGSFWQSGDQITMIVDAKNYTLRYKLNNVDMGMAVKRFNKLLDSDINDRYYVIVSIQQSRNSLTLMSAYRYKENEKKQQNDEKNHEKRWKSLKFLPSFGRKSKEEQIKSQNDDANVLNKLNCLQMKYETLLSKYGDLERTQNKKECELKKIKKEMMQNKKELDLSRGVMHELKKLSIHKLHELEANLLSSLQNVQKAIASQYENKYDCRVCMTNEKNIVLIPCGHFLCSQCVEKVNECPMCRAQIDNTVKLN